jgi:hypothetical protein
VEKIWKEVVVAYYPDISQEGTRKSKQILVRRASGGDLNPELPVYRTGSNLCTGLLPLEGFKGTKFLPGMNNWPLCTCLLILIYLHILSSNRNVVITRIQALIIGLLDMTATIPINSTGYCNRTCEHTGVRILVIHISNYYRKIVNNYAKQ